MAIVLTQKELAMVLQARISEGYKAIDEIFAHADRRNPEALVEKLTLQVEGLNLAKVQFEEFNNSSDVTTVDVELPPKPEDPRQPVPEMSPVPDLRDDVVL